LYAILNDPIKNENSLNFSFLFADGIFKCPDKYLFDRFSSTKIYCSKDCIIQRIDSISPVQQEAYISLLKKGASMIFLHHSLVSYQHWPEFIKIVGGQYHTHPVVVNGDTLNANYEHDVNIPVKVEDSRHPVTRGISDFEIFDEVYGGVEILPNVKPLLSTTHPKSMRYLAWVNHYANSEVIYIQLGHGPSAYSNPHFRKLIQQAIEWSARQSKK